MLQRCFLIAGAIQAVAAAAQSKTYTLPPDKLAKAIEYAAARNRLHFMAAVYGVLVLLGVLAWRLAPRIRTWAEGRTSRRILQAYLFAPLLLIAIDLMELPVAAYSHHLSLKYEQSIQGWGSWLWDWTKGELLAYLLAGVVIWILYGSMRRSPRRWWFYFWLAAVPMVVFLMFIEPLVIEPLFFKFEPLQTKHARLVADISKVTARGGLHIPPDRMFEMKASEKLKSLNAYVAGIGASKRVVVWDNTIQKMNTAETLFVFGHEMGHYVLGHIWIGIIAAAGGILIFLILAYHTMHWILARWGPRWSIRDITDWASLPVLLLVLAVFGFFSEPLSNSFSRMLEHNADIYGLEVIHGIVPNSSQEAAEAFQILGEISLDDPNPSRFIEFWLYDHPSISERVRFASEYDPWGAGKPPEYVK
ncbi:MAG: M48 family metallopeptidase [Bryobacteraceae bacterium]